MPEASWFPVVGLILFWGVLKLEEGGHVTHGDKRRSGVMKKWYSDFASPLPRTGL